MSAPPASPPPGAPSGRPRWVVPVIAGAAVLFLCCVGSVVAIGVSGDDEDEPAAAGTATPDRGAADGGTTGEDRSPEPAGETEPASQTGTEPEPEPEPEPAGFGAGVWEVDSEIPAGTYVTTVPDGGAFDSCYWARLSGFSGDFDDIIANGNLATGARGRLTLSGSDAGVELSGPCEWVEVSEAAPADVGDEVGAGVWAVGDEIPAGTYTTDASEGDALDSCYWARLSGFSGDFEDIIANGNIQSGSRGRVEIAASDAGVIFSGDCTWTAN